MDTHLDALPHLGILRGVHELNGRVVVIAAKQSQKAETPSARIRQNEKIHEPALAWPHAAEAQSSPSTEDHAHGFDASHLRRFEVTDHDHLLSHEGVQGYVLRETTETQRETERGRERQREAVSQSETETKRARDREREILSRENPRHAPQPAMYSSEAQASRYLTTVRGPSASPTSIFSTYRLEASGCSSASKILPTRSSTLCH